MVLGAYQPEPLDSNNGSLLTKEVILMLNASLSKQGTAILKALYESPEIQQKNLAVNIHTSAASLSNIISKMEAIQPSLLKSERIGRSKFYSLTDTAIAYVESELLPKEKPASPKIRPFNSSSLEDALINETIHFFERFQNAAGREWFMILDDLLSGIMELNQLSGELYDGYMRFMESLIQLRIQQKSIAIRRVYDVVNNNILIKRLERYLDRELKELYVLEPLFDLEKEDFERACALIDYIFCELRPMIFGSAGILYLEEYSITVEQYYAIHHQISSMINQFLEFHGDKTKAVAYWKEEFHAYNASLRYIASNCYAVYMAEQQKKY